MTSLTVGIAFENNVSTLPLAVASVISQTFGDWELLLVDDGSTDGSLDFVRSLRDPRVRVISDGRNLGLPARLNQIAAGAHSDYVARMDADDAMRCHRLAVQAAYLDEHTEVDVVGSAAYVMDAENRVYGVRSRHAFDASAGAFLGHDLLIHPSIMARRDWLRRNPYDESFLKAQDKELWCRTRSSTCFAKIVEPLLFYRELGNFSMARYRDQKRHDARVVARYGPSAIGRRRTLGRLAAIRAKVALHWAFDATGNAGTLLKMRSRALPEVERLELQRELDELLALANAPTAVRHREAHPA